MFGKVEVLWIFQLLICGADLLPEISKTVPDGPLESSVDHPFSWCDECPDYLGWVLKQDVDDSQYRLFKALMILQVLFI